MICDSLMAYRSSAKTWSNSDVDTRNRIDVTELKHVVHFCRWVRCPPTSTNTNGMSCKWKFSIILNILFPFHSSHNSINRIAYLNFYCKLVNTLRCLSAMQYILLGRNIIWFRYSINLIEKITNWITLKVKDREKRLEQLKTIKYKEIVSMNWVIMGQRVEGVFWLKSKPRRALTPKNYFCYWSSLSWTVLLIQIYATFTYCFRFLSR